MAVMSHVFTPLTVLLVNYSQPEIRVTPIVAYVTTTSFPNHSHKCLKGNFRINLFHITNLYLSLPMKCSYILFKTQEIILTTMCFLNPIYILDRSIFILPLLAHL